MLKREPWFRIGWGEKGKVGDVNVDGRFYFIVLKKWVNISTLLWSRYLSEEGAWWELHFYSTSQQWESAELCSPLFLVPTESWNPVLEAAGCLQWLGLSLPACYKPAHFRNNSEENFPWTHCFREALLRTIPPVLVDPGYFCNSPFKCRERVQKLGQLGIPSSI